ncbi:hypothetical protein WMW72_03105 [Paenibacillus filicis]|uniref:Nesprin-1 n=1 Tax=Paenibacillus filicis TaxID=669464 RepID=A0ABU9DDF9_9BACL
MENHLQAITAELLALHHKYSSIGDSFEELDKWLSKIEDRMCDLETKAAVLPATGK